VAEVGDLAKLKLNMCPDEEVGWVWPCVGGGCGEGVDFRGDWVELSVAADGESSDSCLMLSLEKSMDGLVLRRSASSSSLNGVTQALVGVLLRGVIAPARLWSAATASW
jgi:hypothetical protein